MGYSYFLGFLVVALIFLVPVFLVTWLLRVSRRLVVPVSSPDRKLLARRLLYGVTNWALIVLVAGFFFPKDLTPQWLLAIPVAVVLVGFLSGLVLLGLALLQLFGMAFARPQPPAARKDQHPFKRAA